MKLTIESDGTFEGTHIDFSMRADEIPNMVKRRRRRKVRQLHAVQLTAEEAPLVVATAN